MMPLREIRVKSDNDQKGLVHNTKIVPANPENRTFKRFTDESSCCQKN